MQVEQAGHRDADGALHDHHGDEQPEQDHQLPSAARQRAHVRAQPSVAKNASSSGACGESFKVNCTSADQPRRGEHQREQHPAHDRTGML